jgi:hypothetical protein
VTDRPRFKLTPTDESEDVPNPRLGRTEQALNKELRERDDIDHAERAMLRAQARAVDIATAAGDPYAISQANRVLAILYQSAGLSLAGAPATDTFAELLAEMAKPSGNVGHTTQPGPG